MSPCYTVDLEEQEIDVSDDQPKWDAPENKTSSSPDEAGDLAKKHGISPDRAQMLVDRLGHDPAQLEAAAAALNTKQKST